ncbi:MULTISPECIES: hypothetical protein [Marinovum]|uniref:hypothetical protein n=1 Tax=Marinovum TaxID=367771 RepID=UPI00237A2D45|nr:hypothetical protein [Marinovum sp. PR37]MDD9744913.1 hypothetical protein [Marinovum sp. PR37]
MWFSRIDWFKLFAPLLLAFIMAATCGAAVAFAQTAGSQTASAGLIIRNTATASYFNARLGLVETVRSNTVAATVVAVPAFELSGRSDLILARGATSFHQYDVTNVGNVVLEMDFDVADSGTTGVITDRSLFIDVNGNGIVDSADREIAMGETVTLGVDETLALIYVFDVAHDATPGDTLMSELMASGKSANGAVAAASHGQAMGSVEIVDAALQLEKTFSHMQTAEGTQITYRLRLYNNSQSPVAAYDSVNGAPIMIDGTAATGVVVRDAIPLNTEFVSAGSTMSLVTLYHLQGTPEQQYVSSRPADPATVDAVAFFHRGAYPVGQFREVHFTVLRPLALSAGEVLNIAETFVEGASRMHQVPSNRVRLAGAAEASITLDFVDPQTDERVDFTDPGTDTALRVVSGACNISREIDRVEIEVRSTITGDVEYVTATETGPNTGIFDTAALPIAEMLTPVAGDGVMASVQGDLLSGLVVCAGISAADDLMITPGLMVFDSVTNAAVAGAVIELTDASGTVVATSTSGPDGFAAMGQAVPGDYSLMVRPPAEYSFPSVRDAFGGYGRKVMPRASFGQVWTHGGGMMARMDIPLDPFYGVPLALEKSANKTKVQSGEFVLYTLTATNNMNQALIGARISDRLPRNAVMVGDSARLAGEKIDDPQADGAGAVVFELGDLAPLESVTLEYVLRFTPTTKSGDRINEAVLFGDQAGTGQRRLSNIARAKVRLNAEGGVFSREGTILGSVFLDCNENGIMDGDAEIGVPGVRLVTQQGLAVVTDRDGKYSLFGLKPISHVLALQSSTLPLSAKPRVSRTADMLQAGSRLVALKRGELRAENFPLEGCTPAAFAEVQRRAEAMQDRDDGEAKLLSDLPIDGGNPDSRSARSEAGLATTTQVYGSQTPLTGAADLPADQAEAANQPGTLEEIIKQLDQGFGFLGLADGDRVSRRSLKLRVKGPADLTLRLEVNGKEVGGDRVGEHAVWEGGNLQAKEYIALRLNPGANKIRLSGTDPFGIARKSAEITITAPGDPARIEIVAPAEAQAAPGSAIPVLVRILDARGNPAQAAAVVTLMARNAEWDVTDIRDDQPGVQVYLDNGEATYDLLAPQNAGPETIGVQSGFGDASTRILFKPDLADRILVGLIEGAVGLRDGALHVEDTALSPFEDSVSGLRGEVYLKGRIRGDALLTLRYSSDRDTEDRLFRDIRADEYYPVYGDNSERGFDAQSSTNLFVKVEKGASYILYGDIAIEPEDPAFKLGGYRDVTTGVKAHWEGETARVTVFAARTAQKSRTVELRGRGISGPYDIDLRDFREGSDLVELLLRDEDTGEILSTTRLRRLIDYTLDYFRNTIIFDTPLRQADEEGNPISVRVTYQIEGEGDETYWLYGAEAGIDLSERSRAGVRVVRSDGREGSDERFAIDAGFVEHQLSRNASVTAEIARSENGQGAQGTAARIAYEYATDESRFQIEASTASEDFAPPGAPVRPGTTQAKLSYETKLTETAALTASAEYVQDRIAGTERANAELGVRRKISETTRRTDALRLSRDLQADADEGTELLWVQNAEWRPESTPGVKLSFDLELPLVGVEQGTLRIGGDYELRDGLRIFGQAELSFGPLGDALTDAQIGAEYRMTEWLTGRSEMTSAVDQGTRVVQGLNGKWELSERVSLRAGLEHSFDLGAADSRLTSLALGAKWTSEDGRWIGEAAFDQTVESAGYTAFTDLGLAGQVSPDLTLLARSRYAFDGRDGADKHRHRLRTGMSYRPKNEARANVLAWYENRLEVNTIRSVDHLWSVAGTWDANPRLRLNGKYAGQYSAQGFENGADATGLMQLVQAGVTGEVIANRLEASVNAYHMWDNSGFSSQALGVEAGLVVDEGVMVSLGYTHARETLPYDSAIFEDGFYLKLRLKLDDSLWDQLDRFLGG